MDFLERDEQFDLSAGQLADLEGEARQALGDEAYERLVVGISREVMSNAGTGDIPPGYDPDTDPLRMREKRIARNILLGTAAALGIIGSAVAAYNKLADKESDQD